MQQPPQPLPERLWGEQWRFATFPAGDIKNVFSQRPVPILEIPAAYSPLDLGLASHLPIPGVVIYGGRQAMILARWLQEAKPRALQYIISEADRAGGLVLHAGENERWIVATFDDAEVAQAAKVYQQRKEASLGVHFLLVEPDDSGMTSTGFWLLQDG